MPTVAFPDADGAVARFDVTMQRAVAAGLSVAVLQSGTAAALGRDLYPAWWWWSVGPAAAVVTLAAIALCAVGRFRTIPRLLFVAGLCACALGTAAAADPELPPVGTAILPVVVVAVLGIGFLTTPLVAVTLGGSIIVADTVLPALLRPDTAGVHLTQTGIQAVILAATCAGGQAARRIATAEERALDRLAFAVGADLAATAARAERRELEREMHDTVLNTLTALGQSALTDSAAVRERCAQDAEFLRTRRSAAEPDGLDLPARLDRVARAATADGFRVDVSVDSALPRAVPGPVGTAVVRATREALANARRHSGATAARLVVRVDGSGVTVHVVDHGRGPDDPPDGGPARLGVRRSLIERMADVGGHATVRATAGGGTTVTIRWPAP